MAPNVCNEPDGRYGAAIARNASGRRRLSLVLACCELLRPDGVSKQRALKTMKLPRNREAIVPELKLTDYLLSETHPVGRAKAKFFRALGCAATTEILSA